jgi:integrative and conjugative element protein (TIGR02256 family)
MPGMQTAAVMLEYAVGETSQRLLIERSVLELFEKYQQKRWYQKEAGGQLFARLDGDRIVVSAATGPRKSDRRSRYSYVADRYAERREIREQYERGLHYLGDWHTHPEQFPQPSRLDVESIGECVLKSQHSLNAFVLIVVGTASFPGGLCVLIHDGREALRLAPTPQDRRGDVRRPHTDRTA